MKRVNVLAVVVLMAMATISVSCGASKKAAQKEEDVMYKKMAEESCECVQPLYEVLKKSDKIDQEDEAAAMAIIGQITKATEDLEQCLKTIEKKYPSIDFKAESNPKAEKALRDNCEAIREMEKQQKERKQRRNK